MTFLSAGKGASVDGERWWRVRSLVLSATLAASLLGCAAGPTGAQGPAGSMGQGSVDGAFRCTPGAALCVGNRLWSCTLSGLDAVGGTNCNQLLGSATNPGTCQTSGCPSDAGACCERSKPTCVWNLTAPLATSGDTNNPPAGMLCAPPSSGNCASTPFTVVLNDALTCPATSVVLSISRAKAQPGSRLALPNPAVTLGAKGCFFWSGTVTWVSDVPAWKVQVDATCTKPADARIVVEGTFSGNL
jgi:hypothetical protein